jgi:hypothetical protein
MSVGMVKIGDYVQLKSLSVATYGGVGTAISNVANLKVKVVGINPYKSTGLNTDAAKAHVVFQFEKVVTTRRMRAIGNNYGGSEMQTYLTGNFYNGLKDAGVPDGVLWAVKRRIGTHSGSEDLSDKVFLPTLWEVTGGRGLYGEIGSNHTNEESGAQGRLSAYNTSYAADSSRVKYNLTSSATDWWLASGYSDSSSYFCYVTDGGHAGTTNAGSAGGLAPAFCVK